MTKFTHAEKKAFLKTNGYDTGFLFRLVKTFPDINWDWEELSENPNITMEDIQENPDFPWNWRYISQNPNLTLDFIYKNPSKDWDWNYVSKNSGITWEDIKNNIDLPWRWNFVSQNPTITSDIVKENPDKYWAHASFYRNPSMKMLNIEYYIGRIPDDFPSRSNIDIETILFIILKSESSIRPLMYDFSKNSNLTIDLVKKNMNLPWSWFWISENSNINIKDIQENPELPWNWRGLSGNPNITIEFIKNNLDKEWGMAYIIQNPNLFVEDIIAIISHNWGEKEYFLANPNITFDFMQENVNKACWTFISNNKLFYDDTVFNREYNKVKTKEKQSYTKNVLYHHTDVCPDIINEICGYVVL